MINATDGERAVEEALERTPDLPLIDVSMPKLDGYEVTERLRQHEPTSAIPIILLPRASRIRMWRAASQPAQTT